MEQRIDFPKVAPTPLRALLDLDRYLYRTGLEHPLIDLVKLRVAQIEGSEHAVDMFTKRLLSQGMRDGRLDELADWRQSETFSDRERTALNWTEAVTRISSTMAPDEVYDEARNVFSERELVDLTYVVALANAWTRLTSAFRLPPGTEITTEQEAAPSRNQEGPTRGAAPRQPAGSEHITWTTEEQEIRH